MAKEYTFLHWLAAGVNTTAGVAVASGKVRFYQPGTLTPASVYSDTAGVSAISQPITLSAGGTALVYTNAVLRMIVKDSTDTTTLYDVDVNSTRAENVTYRSGNFDGDNDFTLGQAFEAWSTDGGGATTHFWQYLQSATATERPLKNFLAEIHVSVKAFGAVGNGVANDTTAIQSTITAVGAAGGGVVYFPPGTYLINTALTVSSAGVTLKGAGPITTIIKQSNATANCITASGASGLGVNNLQIAHSTSSTGKAISLAAASADAFIEDVITSNFVNSISIADSSQVFINNCVLVGVAADKIIITSGTTGNTYVSNTTISAFATGIEFGGSNGKGLVSNCDVSAATTGISFTAGSNYRVVGCTGLSAATTPFSSSYDPILFQQNNGVDGYTVNVAVGGNHTPSLFKGPVVRIVASSGGAGTVTVNAPTPVLANTQRNNRMTIKYVNASGGAVTWAFAAATFIHVGAAAPANTDLHTISVEYLWDPDASRWREVTRGDTLT